MALAADGAIRMADIPDAWRDGFGDGKGELETFVGTWQLEEHQDVCPSMSINSIGCAATASRS